MVAIARHLLHIIVAHYADDAWGVEPETIAPSAYNAWLLLNKLVGCTLMGLRAPRRHAPCGC